MKENLKVAKKAMKNKANPYQVYGYYFSIPLVIIVVFIISLLGIDVNTVSTIIFVFTILAHVGVSKLKLVSKRKYVAPILMYVTSGIGLIMGILMVFEIANGGTGEGYLVVIGLTAFPIEIIAIIFFFITANDIKKAYPTMKQDSIDARQEYLAIKRNNSL